MKKIVCFVTILSVVLLSMRYETVKATPTVAILDWALLDSDKHLDWDGSTKYQTLFNAAVNTWNAYKPGVIREDTWYYWEDVYISDYYEVSWTCGYTSSAGEIKFNTYTMDNSGWTDLNRQNVCTHELGHALGLDHNQYNDIMYAYNSSRITLSENDKASYDASYVYERD